MIDPERDQLAKRQADLVAALTGTQNVPDQFDEDRVRLAARTLERKRSRTVAKSWPGTAGGLAVVFDAAFADYARRQPLPEDHDDDGANFAAFLARRNLLSDAGRIEWAAWRARRGWPIRLTRITGRLVLIVRLPRGRLRRFSCWLPG